MRRSRFHYAAVPVVLGLLAVSCGKDRESADTTTTAATTTTVAVTTTVADTTGSDVTVATDDVVTVPATDDIVTVPATDDIPDVPMFGDAPWPCSAGDGANTDSGSEPGVTKDSIKIGTGDDAGYTGSPGLNHEMTDTMNAFVKQCNELGGINGRQITLDYYDAKLFDVGPAMQAACDANDFFMVGEGWAFDSNQEEIRLGCNMPAVPTYSVSAAFAHGKDMFVGVPNPSDEVSAGVYDQMATLFPDAVKQAATLVGSFSATQESRDKAVAAAPNFGWSFVSSTIEYNPAGETDWTPFVKQIQAAGATIVYWSGTCLPGLQLFAQTAKTNGLDIPILTDANHYAGVCAAENTDGALDNVYVRIAAVPFEEADINPATQQFVDLVTGNDGDLSLLGTNTASSFLLWATAASGCGAELTRACTLANLKATHDWTGHGLHAATDPGDNHPSACNAILKIEGTKYVRVVPEARGTFECKDNWIVKIAGTPALVAAQLDADRISHQYAG